MEVRELNKEVESIFSGVLREELGKGRSRVRHSKWGWREGRWRVKNGSVLAGPRGGERRVKRLG